LIVVRDWRSKAIQVASKGLLETGIWYRSPLYEKDHLLARTKVEFEDGLAWCGRPLEDARRWDNDEFGNLWYTNRKSAQCLQCVRREKEWHANGTQ